MKDAIIYATNWGKRKMVKQNDQNKSQQMNNYKFSDQEYTSIRAEMIQRIDAINSQIMTAIVTIISSWVAGLTLLIEETKIENLSFSNLLLIDLVRTFVFLIPIFYFIPLAIKSGENLTQIVSISAYIRVFYDYSSIKNDTEKMNWETSNNIMSSINVDRGNKKSKILKLCDETYTILASCSYAIYILFSIFCINDFKRGGKIILIIYIIIIIILAVIAGVSVGLIHAVSCTKNKMMSMTKRYVYGYIDRAKQLGIFSEQEAKTAKRELNPDSYFQ